MNKILPDPVAPGPVWLGYDKNGPTWRPSQDWTIEFPFEVVTGTVQFTKLLLLLVNGFV